MPIKSIEVPSQSRLRELFDYADGQLIWRERPLSDFKSQRACNIWNTRFSGEVAGSINPDGYRIIQIGRVSYRAHRLVYAWHHGSCPSDLQIDHTSGVRSDNRIENLRLATHAENCQNAAKRCDNTSKFVGVCWHKRAKKFNAGIRINGKTKHLGYFTNAEEAAVAYANAAKQLHGTFMHASIKEAQP
jgi:hypothetical protein